MSKTKIIAEIGVNHNGSINLAKKLIIAAKKAGADFVKFQTYITEDLVIKNSPLAEYQKKNINNRISQYDLLKKYELKFSDMIKILNFCKKNNIEFISSAFDNKSLKFLLSLNINYIKIPSGENNNYLLLSLLSKTNNSIIVSTGMTNFKEIKELVLYLKKIKVKKSLINLLVCTSEYPADFNSLNLNLIPYLKKHFKINVGFSDHSIGVEASIAAVALGANIIEKHFTLDKNMNGPDHKSSLEPQEFKLLVQSIRNIEKGISFNKSLVSNKEFKNQKVVRKSIVASQSIKKGEKFTKNNLAIKRPGTGLAPKYLFKILNKKSKKNYQKDDLIEL